MTKVLMLASVLLLLTAWLQAQNPPPAGDPVTTQLPRTQVQCKDAYRAQLVILRLPTILARHM